MQRCRTSNELVDDLIHMVLKPLDVMRWISILLGKTGIPGLQASNCLLLDQTRNNRDVLFRFSYSRDLDDDRLSCIHLDIVLYSI